MADSLAKTLDKLLTKRGARFFSDALDLFNRGQFWESHEVFEEAWRLQEGETRKMVQGFVQAAAAFSYIQKGRYESIIYLFDKSVDKLHSTSHLLPEIDTPALIDAIAAAKEEIERVGSAGLDSFNSALYPHIFPRGTRRRAKRM